MTMDGDNKETVMTVEVEGRIFEVDDLSISGGIHGEYAIYEDKRMVGEVWAFDYPADEDSMQYLITEMLKEQGEI